MSGGTRNSASEFVAGRVAAALEGVEKEVASRAYKASNMLRNASLFVLRGKRSGRRYRVPGTRRYYTASAPGEPPAVRTGAFRLSWGTRDRTERSGKQYLAVSAIASGLKVGQYVLGDLLEGGTIQMAPRPYKQAVIDRAMPEITALFNKPYQL